jgi:hypothetical protein
VIAESALFKLNLGIDLILLVLKITGTIATLMTIYLSSKIAYWLYGVKASNITFIGLCIFPPLAFWSIGGLETPYYLLALITCIYALTIKNNYKYYVASLIMACASLLRPDAMIGSIICLSFLYLHEVVKKKKLVMPSHLKPILFFVIFLLLLTGWRLWYFDAPLPNTFYAKKSEFDLRIISDRILSLLPFVFGFAPLILIIEGDFIDDLTADKKRVERIIYSVISAFIIICLMIRREWMPGYRYELVLVPFAVIIASRYNNWGSDCRSKMNYAKSVLFVLLTATSFQTLRLEVQYTSKLTHSHIALGKWIKENLPAISTISGWDAGAIPLYSGIERYIEIHPEGILSPIIPKFGYQVDLIFKDSPDVIILPGGVGKNPGDKMFKILQYALSNGYRKEMVVYFECDYILEVYLNKGIVENESLINSARILEKESAKNNCPSAYNPQ